MTDSRPVLDQINLVTRDMDASLAFYRRLGVDIPNRDPAWDPHHRSANTGAGIDFDLDSEVFAHRWDQGWRDKGPRCVIGFKLASREDVDRLYAELTGAGYAGQQPPLDAFWGARYAVVEDPDQNPVGLMSPIDPSMRSDIEPPP